MFDANNADDLAQLGLDITTIIDAFADDVELLALSASLPFVASALQTEASALLAELDAITGDIEAHLSNFVASAADTALDELIDFINTLTIFGDPDALTASRVGDDIHLDFLMTETLNLGTFSLDTDGSINFGVGAVDIDGSVELETEATFQTRLIVDTDAATISMDDSIADEFSLGINGEISVDAEVVGALGFIGVDVSDTEGDTDALDDINLTLALDIDGGSPTVSLNGSAAFQAHVETIAPAVPVLPQIGADLWVELSYMDSDILAGEPQDPVLNLELRDVKLKLEALTELFQEIFGNVGDILDTFPIGEIVDILTARLPVIDDLAPSSFDLNSDGKISLRDVIGVWAELQGRNAVFDFIDAAISLAEVINAIDSLADSLEEDGQFDIGTLRLQNAALSKIANGEAFEDDETLVSEGTSDLDSLSDLITALGDFAQYVGLSDGGGAASFAGDNPIFDTDAFNLSFPFLESPEALVNALASLLLNGVGAPPVSLVEFDIPKLAFSEEIQFDFIMTPFVGYLGGRFGAELDITVGYDTAGFGSNFDFLEGFYIQPDLPEVTYFEGTPDEETKQPAATMTMGVFAGGGLDVFIARVAVEGGLTGRIDVFLGGTGPDDNKARLSELAGCFFNDIGGQLLAGVDIVLRFGFGIFSWTERIGIAEIVLAQFSIDPCAATDVGGAIEIEAGGLATEQGSGLLQLNVGDRSDLRTIEEGADAEYDADGTRVGRARAETFIVSAVPEDEDTPAQPGEVAVNAFGVFERFGTDEAVTEVTAAAGDEDDYMRLDTGLAITADFSGGAGEDTLVGGDENDDLSGDDDGDVLEGNAGNDTLLGGAGNDIIDGGAGADSIDGGADFDKIDYSDSDVGVSITVDGANPGRLVGSGGDAEGDRIENVEHLLGSTFDDTLFGSASESNILEGNDGNDSLVGGAASDLFIGGAGADTMRGDRAGATDTASDATSYVKSNGAVNIDTAFNFNWGGHATGDILIGIEDFQLTRYGDSFRGTSARNLVDGYDGDDILDGRLGQDTINGGFGDDTVLARGDGDELDGGGYTNFQPGRDLLSYENAGGSVSVNLRTGEGGGADKIAIEGKFVETADGKTETVLPSGSEPVYSTFEDLTGSSFNDTLIGDDGNNVIDGGGGNDNIQGGAGRDSLIGSIGGDTLSGGSGIDLIDYSNSTAAVEVDLFFNTASGGEAAGDSFIVNGGVADVENILGSDYTDSLRGDDGDNVIDPGGNRFNGTEEIFGRGGTDTAKLDLTDDLSGQVLFMQVNDSGNGSLLRVPGGGSPNTNLATITSIEQFQIQTAGGDDFLVSQVIDGNDLIGTGGGNDAVSFGGGVDWISTGAGDDIVSRAGPITYVNGDYAGTPSLLEDSFLLDGGSDVDTLLLDVGWETEAVEIFWDHAAGEEASETLVFSNGAVAKNFERLGSLVTGSGADTIVQQGNIDNVIFTEGGADVVNTGLGFDIANGGTSFIPTFPGTAGNPHLDVLIVDYSQEAVGNMAFIPDFQPDGADYNYDGQLLLIDGNDTLASVAFDEFERVFATGTDRNDFIGGSNLLASEGDVLNGGAGRDVIVGRAGNDLIIGGADDDTLSGGAGNDTIIGGVARDGEEEQDIMDGGEGADLYVIGDRFSLIYDGQEDTAQIQFHERGVDVIQLHGSASEYFINSTVVGAGVINDFFTVDENGDPERFFLRAFSNGALSLTGDDVTYVNFTINPPIDPFDPIFPVLPGFASDSEDDAASESTDDSFTSLLAQLDQEITVSPELTTHLWRSGAVSDEALMAAMTPDGRAEGASPYTAHLEAALETGILPEGPALPSAALGDDAITQDDPTQTFAFMIDAVVKDFATEIFEIDNYTFYTNVTYSGTAAGAGTFEDAFGLDEGVVLSTGNVNAIEGANELDGVGVIGPRPAGEYELEVVRVGDLPGNQRLYRMELPFVSGGINSLSLTDDQDYLGGLGGEYSAFDLNSLFLSRELIDDTSGMLLADLDAVERLDLITYSTDNLQFTPGDIRGGDVSDLFGSVGGMVDTGFATLGVTDWVSGGGIGGLSLGEGGSLAFNLDAPLLSTAEDKAYLYVTEVGEEENLTGAFQVTASPIGVEGDLSTDLGLPGLEGDTSRLDASFVVEIDGNGGADSIAPYTIVEFFDIVLVTEELPERGGAELPDLVTVKINGFDALVTDDGTQVTLNTLAWSPLGDYDPSLTLNLVGGGDALEDTIRADAYTATYRVRAPIIEGVNTVEVSVADQADPYLDTAIFIAPLDRIGPPNVKPIAREDKMSLREGATDSLNVITGQGLDIDPDDGPDPLAVNGLWLLDAMGNRIKEIQVGDAPTDLGIGNGIVEITKEGDFTFSAQENFNYLHVGQGANIQFEYEITDGEETDSTTIFVSVAGVGDADGSSGSDSLTGTSADESFNGFGGNDLIAPGEGDDEISTGSGMDTVLGTLAELNGDQITDFAPGDQIFIPDIAGESQFGLVREGATTFLRVINNDERALIRLDGVAADASFLTVSGPTGTAMSLTSGLSNSLTEFSERFVTRDAGDNTVVGSDGGDTILTGAGDDLVEAGNGSDVVVAEAGADTLIGGQGNDALTGGSGPDVFAFSAEDFSGFTVDTIVDFTTGEDRIELFGFGTDIKEAASLFEVDGAVLVNLGDSRFIRVEGHNKETFDLDNIDATLAPHQVAFFGPDPAVRLTDANDRYIVPEGKDLTVFAGGGADFVLTGQTSDEVSGGAESDTIQTGAGKDILIGGPGNDLLTGGADSDRFVFALEPSGGFIVDTITDFEVESDIAAIAGGSLDEIKFLDFAAGGAAQIGETQFIVFEGVSSAELEAKGENIFDFA